MGKEVCMTLHMDTLAYRELGVATNVFRVRAQALNLTAGALDASFVDFVRELNNISGRILVMGKGASDCAARHTAHMLALHGTPALYMALDVFRDNAAWIFTPGDAVLAFADGKDEHFLEEVSFSVSLRRIPLFVVACHEDSVPPEARRVLCLPEGTGSTSNENFALPLVAMALGDALALGLMRRKGVDENICRTTEVLGSGRFRRVGDIMRVGTDLPLLPADATLGEARLLLRRHAPCVVGVLKRQRLSGVISDADFRRIGKKLELDVPVTRVMRAPTVTLREDTFVVEALRMLRESGAPALFVLRERHPVGLVDPYDCLRA